MNSAFKERTQGYCTVQDRLSAKFQALYASGMYKNERLAMSLEILHSQMDLFHKMYQVMTKYSYVPFIIAPLAGLQICHFPSYADFQMPENKKSQIIFVKPLKIV